MKPDPNDIRWSRELRATPVPPDLHASLLAQANEPPKARAGGPRRRLQTWGLIAVAAVVLLAFGGFWHFAWQPTQHFHAQTEYRTAMAYYIDRVPFQLDFTSQQLGAIKQWLGDSAAPPLPAIPASLGARVPLGCKRIQWGETTVSLVCFYESIPDGRIVHLFIAPRSALADPAFAEINETVFAHGRETRGWSTEEWVCILVPSDPAMRIAHFLDQPNFVSSAA